MTDDGDLGVQLDPQGPSPLWDKSSKGPDIVEPEYCLVLGKRAKSQAIVLAHADESRQSVRKMRCRRFSNDTPSNSQSSNHDNNGFDPVVMVSLLGYLEGLGQTTAFRKS
mmetsp:Transcript_2032/g.5612  ORF Transcript_2032/g.5612 Transcript_2032/m.5612 type:complete len:110 (-) Transcript_2032:422-751(-)